jgi:hypothetical protein
VYKRIEFSYEGINHTVGVRSLSLTSITIIVQSTPQTTTLDVGETKQFDLDANGTKDISVTLDSIINKKANITVKFIEEPKVQPQVNTPIDPITPTKPTPVVATIPTTPTEQTQPQTAPMEPVVEIQPMMDYTLPIIAIIVIIFVVIAYIIVENKKGKK